VELFFKLGDDMLGLLVIDLLVSLV